MDIKIRKAREDDLEKLLRWGKKLWQVESGFELLLQFSEEEARQRYSKEIKSDKSLFLIAEEDEKPSGYLYSYLKEIPDYLAGGGEYCELEVVFVEKEARNKGLADKMIDECVMWAKSNNAKFINAGVYAKNIPSLKLLNKKGFENYHLILQKHLE